MGEEKAVGANSDCLEFDQKLVVKSVADRLDVERPVPP
jgi:hypothetical protein